MRLQCPNCDAEYEVDRGAIPQEGRDVQCSNCGHGWFQTHPDYTPDPDMESALYDPPPPLAQARPGEMVAPRRDIDPAAMRILREEAAREEALRARDNAARAAGTDPALMGDLPQLGASAAAALSAAAPAAQARIIMPARAAMRRINRVRLDADELPAAAAALVAATAPQPQMPREAPLDAPSAPSEAPRPDASQTPPETTPRRPVADMIDPSTLKSTIRQQFTAEVQAANLGAARSGKPKPEYTDPEPGDGTTRRGILGTVLGVIVAALAALAYVFAADLAARAPQLAPYLQFYVNIVDVLRDLLRLFAVWAWGMLMQGVQAVMALVQGS